MDPHTILPPKSTLLSFYNSLHFKIMPYILLPLLLVTSNSSSSLASSDMILYKDNCSSFVAEAIPTGLPAKLQIQFLSGYVTKGEDQFSDSENSSNTSSYLRFGFYKTDILKTQSVDVFQINTKLYIRYAEIPGHTFTAHTVNDMKRSSVSFSLSGFWSASTGKLCLVGDGDLKQAQSDHPISGILKMNYANKSNIYTSLVTGTIEIFDSTPSHFEPMKFVTYSYTDNYEYTLTENVTETCSRRNVEEDSLKFPSNTTLCMDLQSYFSYMPLRLNQMINCSSNNCGAIVKSPKFLSLNTIKCSEDGKLHLHVKFSNSSWQNYNQEFEPDTNLVAEGFWDHKSNRICLIACRVLVDKATGDASVGDCTIGLSLWFPSVLSLKNRNTVVGQIWSNKNKNDSGYFSTVSFNNHQQHSNLRLPGVKYNYTELDNVKKYSNIDVPKFRNKKFPNATSTDDLRFHFIITYSDGNVSSGRAKVMSVGDKFYGESFSYIGEAYYGNSSFFSTAEVPTASTVDVDKKVWNISYLIYYYKFGDTLSGPINLYVEGVYNSSTGKLCMTGCLDIGEDKIDCSVLVKIQLSTLDPDAREHITGKIKSTRSPKDPLYFDELKFYSIGMYREQAIQSIQRMDIEIIMVIVSLTFSCICIVVQLWHVKKHPDVLPYLSIFMLVILTLGHMIPLLLNFEALFMKNQNKQAVLLSSGGWVETHEVIVRVITMVAFLLQFRLLQRAWSAKVNQQHSNSLWIAEKRTLKLCLPLYLAGGFLAWFAYLKPSSSQLVNAEFGSDEQIHTIWRDLTTYSGLVLDGFLLPQIILNIFLNFNSNKAPLKFVFYIGTTIVRAAPHLYDAYRARHYVPFLNSSYIYASRDDDFYSLVWDVIIPCGGVLFAVLIFLQQRYGGMHIFPAKLRKLRGGYEEVPVVDA